MGALTSTFYDVDGYEEAIDLAYRAGWSDGLPVVPPTEPRIRACLDAAGLEPDDTVVEIVERGRTITAEKLAINAVMAGCLPEYMPVLVATLEAMVEPAYRFNHLASMGSPWPLIVVNGPVAERIGLHSGGYLFGPGHRANVAIARGLSLVLRNCAGAKFEDTQRGQWGNPMRFVGCIAENETLGWTPLHVQRGFQATDSVVTVGTVYPGSPVHVTVNERGRSPERLLNSVCHAMANWGGAIIIRGVYTLLVGPHYVELFREAGWSKDDIRGYVIENAKVSVAALKEREAWGKHIEHLDEQELAPRPEDATTYVHMLRKHPSLERYVSWAVTQEPGYQRDIDLFVVGCGGDAGGRLGLMIPNYVSTNPVSALIRTP